MPARTRVSASVAVYADQDLDALHVRVADEAYALGGQSPAETYLDIDKLLGRGPPDGGRRGPSRLRLPGRRTPGFAQAVIDAGLTWIGPPPAAIDALGDKVHGAGTSPSASARPWWPGPPTRSSGVGRGGRVRGGERAAHRDQGGLRRRRARPEGGPHDGGDPGSVRLGGARGRHRVRARRVLRRALPRSSPRHVETQCLADSHGNVVVVSTRDCSLSAATRSSSRRRPRPFLTEEQMASLYDSSKAILARSRLRGRRAPASSSSARTARSPSWRSTPASRSSTR